MQEILNKLNEVVSLCNLRVSKCEIDAQNNATEAIKNKEEADRLEVLGKELAKKSKRLKELQDVSDAQGAVVKAQEEAKEVERLISASRKEFSAEVDKKNAALEAREKDIIRRLEKIGEAENKLAEDKKVFRAKIIEDVHREMALRKSGI